jgi:DNA-binding transcriptional LysR family regulator
MLNPVHLRTLTTVVRTGSFADAARRLGYTGSAVSQQIASLERAVKVPLFERDAHSVRPTAAGEFIAERAADSLAALGSLEDDVRGMSQGLIGRLRLGSFPTASERLLPLTLASYARRHPDVEIRLDEGEPHELIALLQVAELDLALVYRYNLVPLSWPRTVTATRLLDESLVLLLPREHHLAGPGAVPVNDLRDETWISTRQGTSGASCLRRMCAAAGFEPRVAYRTNDYGVITSFVASGLGIAMVPTLGLPANDGVTTVQLRGSGVFREVTVLHGSSKANPAVGGVVRELQKASVALARQVSGVTSVVTDVTG